MAFKRGTVVCELKNIMGMPSDKGTCEVCGEIKWFYGDITDLSTLLY